MIKKTQKNSQKADRKGGRGGNAYGQPDRKISAFFLTPSLRWVDIFDRNISQQILQGKTRGSFAIL